MRIGGLNPRCAAAVWRSDSDTLDYFDCFRGKGYVTFNADRTVEFFAGNVAITDPALFVSVANWDEREAWFELHNPTPQDITTSFATAPAIRGRKPVATKVTVKAGSSLKIRE